MSEKIQSIDSSSQNAQKTEQNSDNNAWRRDKKDFFQNLQFYKTPTKDDVNSYS